MNIVLYILPINIYFWYTHLCNHYSVPCTVCVSMAKTHDAHLFHMHTFACTHTHRRAHMNWTSPISCNTETRWPFQPPVWNRLQWSLNVDCKSKCVCVYSAAASRLHCEMDFQTRKVMNILIAADNTTNTMNIIQCVVCMCVHARVQAYVCVYPSVCVEA